MRKPGPASRKSLEFARRIVKLSLFMRAQKEFTLSDQMLRAGTSIGSNIVEAEHGSSKKDFHFKMYIAYKECMETLYWLDLIHTGEYITESQYQSLKADCEELSRLLAAITKTTRESFLVESSVLP